MLTFTWAILNFLTTGWLGSKNRQQQGTSTWCFRKYHFRHSLSVMAVTEVLVCSEGRESYIPQLMEGASRSYCQKSLCGGIWLWSSLVNTVLKLHCMFESLSLFFLIGVELIYNVLLVSAVQQSELALHTHISPPS